MSNKLDYQELEIDNYSVEIYGLFDGYWRWTCKVYDKVTEQLILKHYTWTLNNTPHMMHEIRRQILHRL